MARKLKPRSKRRDLYQEVTDKIIAELEERRAPWAQPWGAPCASADAGGRIAGLFETGETEASPKAAQTAKPAKAG